MDEPLGALDALTRINLPEQSLVSIREGKTVAGTHDIEESRVHRPRCSTICKSRSCTNYNPVNIIDRTDRTSASFVNIQNHIFEQFQLAKKTKSSSIFQFYITKRPATSL